MSHVHGSDSPSSRKLAVGILKLKQKLSATGSIKTELSTIAKLVQGVTELDFDSFNEALHTVGLEIRKLPNNVPDAVVGGCAAAENNVANENNVAAENNDVAAESDAAAETGKGATRNTTDASLNEEEGAPIRKKVKFESEDNEEEGLFLE